MLELKISEEELFDERTGEFINIKPQTLRLEHSLVSISKWESKWCEPFLSNREKSEAEILDYIKCMNLTQNVDENIFKYMSADNIRKVYAYINAPMTASWFSNESSSGRNSEMITSELIYYWMVAYQIDMKCEKWHLNRLLTLIKICDIKNRPAKKMSEQELISRYRAVNEQRKKALNTKG